MRYDGSFKKAPVIFIFIPPLPVIIFSPFIIWRNIK